MTPTQIRAELLGQHAEIRVLIAEIRQSAELARRGEPREKELRDGVARLAAFIVAHNAREEELLAPVLPTVDAWGPVRADIMDEGHLSEHRALSQALAAIPHTPREFAGAGVEVLCERILEHMASEEEVLLAEELLRVDTVTVDVGA
jgi:hypothetical protein